MAEEEESPKDLRARLSESNGVAASALARAVIAEQGLTHVKPDDLKGVSLDEIESKAVSLNEQRAEAGKDAMRTMLNERGVENVDEVMDQFLAGKTITQVDDPTPPGVDQEAVDRARRLGGAGGPIRTEDISHLGDDGPAQMRYYFENQR